MYPGPIDYFAQLAGMAGQQATYQAQYQQRAYGAGMHFINNNSTISAPFPISTLDCDDDIDEFTIKGVEIDPFVQLTNHEFHKLLDRFQELI